MEAKSETDTHSSTIMAHRLVLFILNVNFYLPCHPKLQPVQYSSTLSGSELMLVGKNERVNFKQTEKNEVSPY